MEKYHLSNININDTEKKYSTAEMTKNSYRTHNVIAGIRFDI